MTPFFRFPHTPYLAWLGSGSPRDDKVMTSAEVADFLSGELRIEEKVDGANTGISFDQEGNLRVQNRGQYLEEPYLGQYGKLGPWIKDKVDTLFDLLGNRHILFGEWCYAKHSLDYNRLPDWFLAFDVYDRQTESFLDSTARNALANEAKLSVVPLVSQGKVDLSVLERLVVNSPSAYREGPAEGLVLRRETAGKTLARAKLVLPDFVQSITGHWSARSIVANQVVPQSGPEVVAGP